MVDSKAIDRGVLFSSVIGGILTFSRCSRQNVTLHSMTLLSITFSAVADVFTHSSVTHYLCDHNIYGTSNVVKSVAEVMGKAKCSPVSRNSLICLMKLGMNNYVVGAMVIDFCENLRVLSHILVS